ncbi:MAG: hypothetical protein ACOX2F_05200 [bacterium]
MKKLFWTILVLALLVFASCGEKSKKNQSDGENDLTDSESVNDDDSANSGDDSDNSNSGSDEGKTGDTGSDDDKIDDSCKKCDEENRECDEKGGEKVCGDCKEGFFESGNGKCVAKKELGTDCDVAKYSGADCSSGKCVDGVCCNSDCDGVCVSCNVSDFYKGTCTPFPEGVDPDDECEAEEPATCGNTGVCNGVGECQQHSALTQCVAPKCSGNISTEAAFCDGEGNCNDENLKTTNCSPYLCSNDTGLCAGGACSADENCIEGYFCDVDDICSPKKDNGTSCVSDNQCLSNRCLEDDFNTDNLKYCVPGEPSSICVVEGVTYEENFSVCAPATSLNFKICKNNSWGSLKSCTNTTKRRCQATGWGDYSGYLNADSCSNEESGHSCNVDSTCKECVTTLELGENTYTSNFKFDNTKKECHTTCLDSEGYAEHTLCSASHGNILMHYCGIVTFEEKIYGVCRDKKQNGGQCGGDHECLSGRCVWNSFTSRFTCQAP